jgi:hypothetical protein
MAYCLQVVYGEGQLPPSPKTPDPFWWCGAKDRSSDQAVVLCATGGNGTHLNKMRFSPGIRAGDLRHRMTLHLCFIICTPQCPMWYRILSLDEVFLLYPHTSLFSGHTETCLRRCRCACARAHTYTHRTHTLSKILVHLAASTHCRTSCTTCPRPTAQPCPPGAFLACPTPHPRTAWKGDTVP